MATLTNPEAVRLISLAKTFYRKGQAEVDHPTELNRCYAVLDFDDAVEMALRSAMFHIAVVPKKAEPTPADLLVLINDALRTSGTPISLPGLDTLRKQRNLVKHHGSTVDTTMANRCVAYAEDALEAICAKVLGISWAEISLAFLVNDEAVRRHLQAAERYISRGETEEALCDVKAAYVRANPPDMAFIGAFERFDAKDLRALESKYPGVGKPMAAIAMDVDDLRQLLAQALKGTDVHKWMHFQAVTPRVKHVESGFDLYDSPGASWPCGTAQWAFDFALDTILKWQDQGIGPGSTGVAFRPDWPDGESSELIRRVPWRES